MADRLKLNRAGFRQLRTLPAMDRLVLEAAQKVALAAGPEYAAEASPGRNRARAVVVPTTAEAAIETATDPAVLIGAMNAARRG